MYAREALPEKVPKPYNPPLRLRSAEHELGFGNTLATLELTDTMTAPLPPCEAERLDALHRFEVLDTLPEKDFDDLVRLAATICGVPIALVSLVDRERQWFKSSFGIEATETHRDLAFCAHAILGSAVFVVPDTGMDERFRENALVTGKPKIRFYAGHPLTTSEGFNLGTLCAIDRVPRELTPLQLDALAVLARQVVAQLMLRRQVGDLAIQLTERGRIEAELRAEKERFRAFMDHSSAVAFLKDADGRFVYVNEPLTRKFGISEADWLGKTDAELWGAKIARPLREIDLRVLAGNEMVKLLETVPTADGSSSHWQSYKFPITEASGQRYLAGMAVDVTAEKKAELSLRESEEKFRNVVERLSEGVLLAAMDSRRVLEANAACLQLFGYTEEEFSALTLYELADHDRASSDANCESVARAEQRHVVGRRKYRHKSGRILDVDLSASVVSHGGRQAFCIVVRDAGEQQKYEDCLLGYQTELERANHKLQTLSVTDGLTGIRNRRAFDAALAEAFEWSRRQNTPLSLLLIDVDHFKSFNDSFGHLVGDGVLRAVAQALQDTVRTTDFLARYGGEEFVVILPDTDEDGAVTLAERCRRAVAAANWAQRPVTVSIGASTLADATGDAAALVREADEALYRSKETGRNRVLHGSGAIPMLLTRRG